MARRSDHSRQELKTLVIEATQAIVAEDIERLTARHIASKIGYTVGTLYNTFKNLDDIILHVNANSLEKLHEQMFQAMNQSIPEVSPIHALGRAYIRFAQAHKPFWQLLFQHRYQKGTVLPEWYQTKVDSMFGLAETAYRKSYPSLSDADIARGTRVLWSGLHGIVALSMEGKLDTTNSESADALADSLVQCYCAGLADMRMPNLSATA